MNTSTASRAASAAKLRKPAPRKFSPLLEGVSITKQLQNSSFGRFHAAVHDIKSYLPMVQFKLPTVIVVGGRSAGKSSLLENITKCPIFPRDPALCTKMPVKLQLIEVASETDSSVTLSWRGAMTPLESKDDILAEVAKIMKSVDSIVSDEVTVTICQTDVTTMELVDLPGIQTFPDDYAKATTALVTKYLNKPDTLVLCVVDATIPSLDSSTALAMIRAADKLPNTILALTKSDLVRSEIEIVERIFDRVLGSSSDNQHLVGLAGCVAVANRNHLDHVSLVEADVEERCYFQAMLDDPAEAYAPVEVQQKLRDNMTIKKLIVKLDSLFHNFIVMRWKPAALTFLSPLQEQAQDEIQKLGPSVDAMSNDGVMEAVLGQVDFEAICSAIRTSCIQVTKNSQLCSLANHMSYHLWGTVSWAESMNKIEEKVTKAVRAALASDKYLLPVVEAFGAVFDKSTPLKLKRFTSLKKLLLTVLLPARVAEAKEAAAVVINDMLQKALQQLNHDSPVDDLFQKLDGGIRGCVIRQMTHHLKNGHLNLPESFILAEDDKVKRKRTRLTDKLSKIQTATDKISHIEEAISVSNDSDNESHSPQAQQDVPDYADWHGNTLFGAPDIPHPTSATITAPDSAPAKESGELQMQAVPEASAHTSQHGSVGAEEVKPPSTASTPVPVSVPVKVSDHSSDTAEQPQASASFSSNPVPVSAEPAEHDVPAEPALAAHTEEIPITNSNLACSMALLGTLQLDSPGSAAEMAADLESLQMSPTASVAESYMIV